MMSSDRDSKFEGHFVLFFKPWTPGQQLRVVSRQKKKENGSSRRLCENALFYPPAGVPPLL